MSIKIKHWTERSIKDYMFRISSDFVDQIQAKMDSESMTQQEVAARLKVSKGRVSQLFNNPGNLTLSNIVKISRVIGVKVSIVAYDDDDPQNLLGPVNSEVFTICWKRAGKPHDFWNLKSTLNQFHDFVYSQCYPGVTAADITVIPVTEQTHIADFTTVTCVSSSYSEKYSDTGYWDIVTRPTFNFPTDSSKESVSHSKVWNLEK